MATSGRILRALALFITVLGAVAQDSGCEYYVRYSNRCTFQGIRYESARSDQQCRAACNNDGRCAGYMWDTTDPVTSSECYLFDGQVVLDNGAPCPGISTYVNNCSTSYPPYPTTRSPFPPFGSSESPCPPVEGLGEGLVALVCVFSAVGGAILGMLLACCFCPRKARFGNASKMPSSDCPQKHVAMPAPGREIKSHVAMPSVEPGRVYSVPKTSLNGEPYTVNISVR